MAQCNCDECKKKRESSSGAAMGLLAATGAGILTIASGGGLLPFVLATSAAGKGGFLLSKIFSKD